MARRSHVSAAHQADNLPCPLPGAVSLRPAFALGCDKAGVNCALTVTRQAASRGYQGPGWLHLAAQQRSTPPLLPSDDQHSSRSNGIRAADGCSGKLLRIRRLSKRPECPREERRALSDSQHWLNLALLLPLVHLLKLLKNLVAQLVHLRW